LCRGAKHSLKAHIVLRTLLPLPPGTRQPRTANLRGHVESAHQSRPAVASVERVEGAVGGGGGGRQGDLAVGVGVGVGGVAVHVDGRFRGRDVGIENGGGGCGGGGGKRRNRRVVVDLIFFRRRFRRRRRRRRRSILRHAGNPAVANAIPLARPVDPAGRRGLARENCDGGGVEVVGGGSAVEKSAVGRGVIGTGAVIVAVAVVIRTVDGAEAEIARRTRRRPTPIRLVPAAAASGEGTLRQRLFPSRRRRGRSAITPSKRGGRRRDGRRLRLQFAMSSRRAQRG